MNLKHLQAGCVLATVTLSGAALAAAHIVDIAWSPDGRFEHQAQIAAGKFVEVCGPLAPGGGVRWRFTAGAPVDFNIHYHLGKETVFLRAESKTGLPSPYKASQANGWPMFLQCTLIWWVRPVCN